MKYFIDFEATQFSERIINIGCVAENGQTFSTLVKPALKKDKVNAFITELTGITNEMLETAPSADEAFNALFDFVLKNSSSGQPEYYCYGDADTQFIERTVSHMTDVRAITFARALQATLIDFSHEVKLFFETKNNIALRKAYALVQNAEIEQHHDALEDAQMLFTVVTDLKTKCKPEDKSKLANMKKTEKPVSGNNLKRAPERFLTWPNDKWDANTGADENNWNLAIRVGPHIKYFDNEDTAMLWIMRYISKGLSVKNLTHQQKVKDHIALGITTNKKSYGFEWFKNTVKEEDNNDNCQRIDGEVAEFFS